MAAQPLEADCTECLQGFDSVIINPEPYHAAAESFLSTDDGMDFESSDLWLPPLESPVPSLQLPQQLSQQVPPLIWCNIDAQLQYVSIVSEAIHVPDLKLPQISTQSQPWLPRKPVTPSTVDCTCALQRLTAIASNFQQKSALLVCPAPVHAAASLLAFASQQLMPTRQQKAIDAAVL